MNKSNYFTSVKCSQASLFVHQRNGTANTFIILKVRDIRLHKGRNKGAAEEEWVCLLTPTAQARCMVA